MVDLRYVSEMLDSFFASADKVDHASISLGFKVRLKAAEDASLRRRRWYSPPSPGSGPLHLTRFFKTSTVKVFTAQVIALYIEENVGIDQATITRIRSLVRYCIDDYMGLFLCHPASGFLRRSIKRARNDGAIINLGVTIDEAIDGET